MYGQVVDEVKVNPAYVVTAVHQNEEAGKVRTFHYVVIYYLCYSLAPLLPYIGETVARQINEIPIVVYQEMVYHLGFARGGRCHCQLAIGA